MNHAVETTTQQQVKAAHAQRGVKFACTGCGFPVKLLKGELKKPHFAHIKANPACNLYDKHEGDHKPKKKGSKGTNTIEKAFQPVSSTLKTAAVSVKTRTIAHSGNAAWDTDLECTLADFAEEVIKHYDFAWRRMPFKHLLILVDHSCDEDDLMGAITPQGNRMVVVICNVENNVKEMVTTLFHELGHCLMMDEYMRDRLLKRHPFVDGKHFLEGYCENQLHEEFAANEFASGMANCPFVMDKIERLERTRETIVGKYHVLPTRKIEVAY